MPKTTDSWEDQQHLIELARHVLNDLGYDAYLPQLMAIFQRNVATGRVNRLRREKTGWELTGYLVRLAQTYQSESPLVQALQMGEEKEQAEFWQKLSDCAYDYLLHLGVSLREAQEQACDAAQDAWYAICSGKASYPYDVAFSRWSKTVLYNHLRRAYRSCQDVLDRPDVVMLDAYDTDWLEYLLVPETTEKWNSDYALILEQAFDRTSLAQQQSLRLFYFDGHPAKQIAEALNCTEAVVNTNCYRGRKKMAKYFRKRGLDLNDLLPMTQSSVGGFLR